MWSAHTKRLSVCVLFMSYKHTLFVLLHWLSTSSVLACLLVCFFCLQADLSIFSVSAQRHALSFETDISLIIWTVICHSVNLKWLKQQNNWELSKKLLFCCYTGSSVINYPLQSHAARLKRLKRLKYTFHLCDICCQMAVRMILNTFQCTMCVFMQRP